MKLKKKKPPIRPEFTLFLSEEEVETQARDGDDLTYDGFRVFIDRERNNEIPRDDECLSMPGVFFSRVAGPNEHTRELAHPSIDIGAALILRPEPSNRFDKNAIQIVNPRTGGVIGYVPAPIARELADTAPIAKGGSGCVLGIWKKRGRVVGLRVVGSIGRTFGITTD